MGRAKVKECIRAYFAEDLEKKYVLKCERCES